MNILSKWSAIVYARTYSVDFRFIAIPEGFSQDELAEIEPYVLMSTSIPEKLLGKPRWSLIRMNSYSVFGVTCMASELVIPDAYYSDWIDKTKDDHGRSLYLFAGYACKDIDAIIPKYEQINLSLFSQLYRYVVESWFLKHYEKMARKTNNVPYNNSLKCIIDESDVGCDDLGLYNVLSDSKIMVIPDTDHQRKNDIWNMAAIKPGKISLCMDLDRLSDALKSPFFIVSAPIEKEELIEKKIILQEDLISDHLFENDRNLLSEDKNLKSNDLNNKKFEKEKLKASRSKKPIQQESNLFECHKSNDSIENILHFAINILKKEVGKKVKDVRDFCWSSDSLSNRNQKLTKENKINDINYYQLHKSPTSKSSKSENIAPKEKGKTASPWDLD